MLFINLFHLLGLIQIVSIVVMLQPTTASILIIQLILAFYNGYKTQELIHFSLINVLVVIAKVVLEQWRLLAKYLN